MLRKNHSEDEIKAGRSSPKYVSKASLKDVPKKRYISPEERQQIIDELRLALQYNNGI